MRFDGNEGTFRGSERGLSSGGPTRSPMPGGAGLPRRGRIESRVDPALRSRGQVASGNPLRPKRQREEPLPRRAKPGAVAPGCSPTRAAASPAERRPAGFQTRPSAPAVPSPMSASRSPPPRRRLVPEREAVARWARRGRRRAHARCSLGVARRPRRRALRSRAVPGDRPLPEPAAAAAGAGGRHRLPRADADGAAVQPRADRGAARRSLSTPTATPAWGCCAACCSAGSAACRSSVRRRCVTRSWPWKSPAVTTRRF